MGGLVGLEPAEIAQALATSEAMKAGPIDRALKTAQTVKALQEPPGLTFEQRMNLKRTSPAKSQEELAYLRAGTQLRQAQTLAEKGRDYKTAQMYSDANAYYDDLYRKAQDEFGVWKNEMWTLDKMTPATEGIFKDMTYAEATSEIARSISEDNKRIWQGQPPNYATGKLGAVRGRGVADRSIGGMINQWRTPR